MEKEQRKYAVQRLTQMKDALYKKINDPVKKWELTADEKNELIRSGKVKFLHKKWPTEGRIWTDHPSSLFDFSAYVHPQDHRYKKGAPLEKVKAELKAVHDEYQRIMDELQIGDSHVALELLKEFAQFKP